MDVRSSLLALLLLMFGNFHNTKKLKVQYECNGYVSTTQTNDSTLLPHLPLPGEGSCPSKTWPACEKMTEPADLPPRTCLGAYGI